MEASPPRRNLRPFIVLFLVLSCIALACAGYWWLNHDFATTDDAEIDGSLYTISPQIAGRVLTVAVDDNQHVTRGQVLVVLDRRDTLGALARAEAQRVQGTAQLDVAEAQAGEAAAQVVETEANDRQAGQDYARLLRVNPRAITQQQFDAAAAAIAAAHAKVAAAQAELAAAQASVQAARAGLRTDDVAVHNAQLQLSYTEIVAPAAGHVAEKTVEPGNVVGIGAAMMSVVGDPVWVTANYKETQLGGIHPGAAATVRVDAVPGVTFKARVDSIQYGTGSVFSLLPAQNATGNYVKIVQRVPVKIMFDDARVRDYMLAPGMSADPSITITAAPSP